MTSTWAKVVNSVIFLIWKIAYFLCAGLRNLIETWAKFWEIWVNLVKFSRLWRIHPLAWKIATRGNRRSWQRWQAWNLITITNLVKIASYRTKCGDISLNLFQYDVIVTKLFNNYQIWCLLPLSWHWITPCKFSSYGGEFFPILKIGLNLPKFS